MQNKRKVLENMAWISIPNFGDDDAKIDERVHDVSGAKIVEVLYGARDEEGKPTSPENDADGHGTWMAIETGGVYQMLSWHHPAYEGGQQEYGKGHSDNPLSDLESDIAAKENICSRAEELAQSDEWRSSANEMKQMYENWKNIDEWHTPKESELWKRFKEARTKFYDRRDKNWEANKAAKQALISEAAAISNSKEWKAAGEKMKELMDRWKTVGYAGPDCDNALWQAFSTERQVFYDRRSKHYEQLNAEHAVAKENKQTLIAEVRALSSSEEWKTTSEKMKELMDQWKSAGSAGRKDDEILWEEFRDARQEFFDRKNAYFEARNKELAEKISAKNEIVQAALTIVSSSDYSNENADKMRALMDRWKEIGFCGKKDEEKLWQQFSEAKERFWEGRKKEHQSRLQDAVVRKQNQIADLYGQIDHLEGKMEYVMSQDHIDNMSKWIEEKREKIEKLEADVSDIESKLKDNSK